DEHGEIRGWAFGKDALRPGDHRNVTGRGIARRRRTYLAQPLRAPPRESWLRARPLAHRHDPAAGREISKAGASGRVLRAAVAERQGASWREISGAGRRAADAKYLRHWLPPGKPGGAVGERLSDRGLQNCYGRLPCCDGITALARTQVYSRRNRGPQAPGGHH